MTISTPLSSTYLKLEIKNHYLIHPQKYALGYVSLPPDEHSMYKTSIDAKKTANEKIKYFGKRILCHLHLYNPIALLKTPLLDLSFVIWIYA